jgi:transposase
MRLIRELTPENIKLRQRISRESKYYQVRNRAKCLILSYQGLSIKQLMVIFGVSRKTIYNWFTKWEDEKVVGLYNERGRGRKSKLNDEQKEQVKAWAKKEPRQLLSIVQKAKKEWGITVSKDTIKRIIKKLQMRWKRMDISRWRVQLANRVLMKRGLSKEPDEWELEVKTPVLTELRGQEKREEIDLRYLDESGFSLVPYIPYGWQEKNETIIIKSRTGKRINVIGLMNRKNELCYQIIQHSITSKDVIKFLDIFSNKLDRKTVVILDQASIHTSDYFIDKLEEWKQKSLEIFWLPTYSPKLNLIELLWKFVKYEWIDVEAYTSQNSLVKYLEKVFDNFGSEYVINFA